jgi:hypothetical protein
VAGDIDAWLTLNEMRPEDTRNEKAGVGNASHLTLEELANVQLVKGKVAANSLAGTLTNPHASGSQIAIGRWWLKRQPQVIASEAVVFSLEPYGGYAGTLDLLWKDEAGVLVLSDLKTRRAGAVAYRGDKIQVGAYRRAWDTMHSKERVGRATILVAREDGTYSESAVPETAGQAFEHLLATDYITRNWR